MALVLQLQAIQIPAPVGFVNDFARVLTEESRARMTRVIENVRARSRGEMAVVTLPDIAGDHVADVALQIGRQWKVGKAADPGDPARNTGLVVLIVPKETNSSGRGECRIETANGTEAFVTDGAAGEICRAAIPYFQRRDYSGGTEYVVGRLAQLYAREFGFTDSLLPPASTRPVSPVARRRGGSVFSFLPTLALLFFILIILRSGSTSRRRPARGPHVDPLLFAVLADVLASGGRRGRSTRKSSSVWGGGWGGGGGGGGGGSFGGFGGGGGFRGGGGGASW